MRILVLFVVAALVVLADSMPHVFSQSDIDGKPRVDANKLTPYTETLERDGVKATFDLVGVPGGVYLRGSPASEAGRKFDEGPRHPVEMRPFWMGTCEVTWAEYDLFWEKKADEKPPTSDHDRNADAITRPSKANHHDIDWGYGRGKKQPVVAVHIHAAMEYCRWLSAKTGKIYRLPTEAEWEWACRAGSPSAYSFGDDSAKIGEFAWFEKNADDMPHPVALKKPNVWGLFDMHGNVAEYCLDHYEAKIYESFPLTKPTLNPAKMPSNKRFSYVTRGGSWLDGSEKLRSASRDKSEPDWQKKDPQLPQSIWWNNADWVGFRVVRPVEEYLELKGIRSKITRESNNF